MSNRDGKTAKHSKENYRKGMLCRKCLKGHMTKFDCHCRGKGHQHFICNVCHHSNF